MTTTGAPADGISQTIRFGTECTEEVTRRGLLEPCEKPGVAVRIDPNEGTPYAVCARHVRAEMAPLQALADALRAEAEHRADQRHWIEVGQQLAEEKRVAEAERDEYRRNWREAEAITDQAAAAERQAIVKELRAAVDAAADAPSERSEDFQAGYLRGLYDAACIAASDSPPGAVGLGLVPPESLNPADNDEERDEEGLTAAERAESLARAERVFNTLPTREQVARGKAAARERTAATNLTETGAE